MEPMGPAGIMYRACLKKKRSTLSASGAQTLHVGDEGLALLPCFERAHCEVISTGISLLALLSSRELWATCRKVHPGFPRLPDSTFLGLSCGKISALWTNLWGLTTKVQQTFEFRVSGWMQ